MTQSPTKISPEEALQVLKDQRNLSVKKKIDEATPRAVEVLHEILDSENSPPIVRVTAAKDILDRGGHKPIDKLAIAMVQPITGMSFELDKS